MATKNPGVWGIDLGQCALKAVRLELVDGKVTATNFDYIEHPKILSQPDADPDQLTREALETFLSRNDLKGDRVAVSVPGQSGLARFVKLPPVEEKKIGDIVRFEAKQQIPFPLEEVVWDFQKIGAGQVSDGYALETEIGLFAMKRDMVNRALQQFTDVNVEVQIIQMAPLALCNFVAFDMLHKGSPPRKKEKKEKKGKGKKAEKAEEPVEEQVEEKRGGKECIVALDIGTDNSNLVITDGERIIWQRPIPIGGNHFTRALTKEMKLTFAKAEHVKRNAAKSAELRKILLALRPVLNDFVNEVQRSLGYFTNTHRDATIQYMVGLGNAFRLPGLQKFLQEKLQLEVRKLSKLERLEGEEVIAAPQFSENILSFAVAYGLALQGLDITRLHTNLLPQEIRTQRMVRGKKPWAVAAAAALLMAIAALTLANGWVYAIYANADVAKAIKEGENARKKVSDINDEYSKYKKVAEANKIAVNQIAAGVTERFNWNLIYKYIDDCLPQPDPDHAKVAVLTSDNFRALDKYARTKDARKAYEQWLDRKSRTQDPDKLDPIDEQKKDRFIKQNLVQINIEGVDCLYSDNLSAFFQKINKESAAPGLFGLSQEDKVRVVEGKELPAQGWVFAIRGYTYFQPPKNEYKEFIRRTLIENLQHPTNDGVNLFLSEAMKEIVTGDKDAPPSWEKEADKSKGQEQKPGPSQNSQVRPRRIGFIFLFDYKTVENPTPGSLVLAGRSRLPDLIGSTGGGVGKGPPGGGSPIPPGGMPGGKDGKPPVGSPPGGNSDAGGGGGGNTRAGWQPTGEVASAALGGSGAAGGAPPGTTAPPGAGTMAPPPVTPPGRPGTGGNKGTSASTESEPPRTEFVILFVWHEPTTIETTEGITSSPGEGSGGGGNTPLPPGGAPPGSSAPGSGGA